jgi:hypothetical protein
MWQRAKTASAADARNSPLAADCRVASAEWHGRRIPRFLVQPGYEWEVGEAELSLLPVTDPAFGLYDFLGLLYLLCFGRRMNAETCDE